MNRAPLLSEDTLGAPAALEPGSLVPGSTGYWRLVASAMSGVSAFGASLIAAATAAAARAILGAVSLSGDTMTGALVLAQGTGAAGTASLKIPSSPLLVTPEAGAIERLVDKLYFTIGTGAARKPIVLADSSLTSGRIPITYTDGRLIDSTALLFNVATGDITHVGNFSTLKLGIGVAWPVVGNTKLSVGTSIGNFGSSTAIAHFIDNSVNATVNYQNTNVAGYTAFDLFNSAGVKVATYAWSNASAGVYPGALWNMTRTAADMILGTNTVERMRLSAAGVTIGAAGTPVSQVKVYTPTINPTDVAAADEYNEQYFTVTGLAMTDTIFVNPPAMSDPPHSQLIAFRVSAADTLALTFRSVSGTHTPPQGVYRIVAHRS